MKKMVRTYRRAQVVKVFVFLMTALIFSGITAGSQNETGYSENENSEYPSFINEELSHYSDFCRPGKRTLVRGAYMPGANGITFDSEGMLYVAALADRSICVVHPVSGRIIQKLGPDQGVESPDDVEFGPDGSLYWTSFLTGEIGRLTPNGVASTIAFVGPGANAISMSDDGRLFVTRNFIADDLWEVDPDGITPPRLILENIGNLNGMDFGPDGYLYGPLYFLNQVVRVDVDSGEINMVADGFESPAACKFDNDGILHTIDIKTGEVFRIDIESGVKTVIAISDEGLDNLAFNSKNQLFLSNTHNNTISRVYRNDYVRRLRRGGLSFPGGIAVRYVNTIYVTDLFTLKEYNTWHGRELSVAHNEFGDPTFQFSTPFTVSAFGNNLLLTSWFGNSVQIWDPDNYVVLEGYIDFLVPINAIEYMGDIVVAELGSGSVVKRPSGTMDKIQLAGGLYVPAGLATYDNDLWVADWATGTIFQIADDGVTLDPPIVVASGLANPEGMAATPAGDLIVVEVGNKRLIKVNPNSGDISVLSDNLAVGEVGIEGYPPLWIFNGVAVDKKGVIYVTLDEKRQVLRIKNR